MANPLANSQHELAPASLIFAHLNQSAQIIQSSWLLFAAQPIWLIVTTSLLGFAIMLSIFFKFILWLVHRPLAGIPTIPYLSYFRGHAIPDSTLHAGLVLYRQKLATLNEKTSVIRFNILCLFPTILPTGHEGMKSLIANTESKSAIYTPVEPWIGGGLVMVKGGPGHTRKRKLLSPVFHFEALRDYTGVFNRCAHVLVDKFKRMSDQSRLPDGSFVEDIYPHMTSFTLDSAMQCVFSKETKCQLIDQRDLSKASEFGKYLQAVRDMTSDLVKRVTSLLLLFDFIFYLTPTGFRFRRNVRTCWEYSKSVIAERRATNSSKHEKEVAKGHGRHLDFLDILLRCRDDKGMPMEEDEIIRECNTFMFAGHDSTAATMTWLLLHLASNPTIQEKCRQEVKALFEENMTNNGNVDLNNEQLMNKMPYLSACLKETLRVTPPVPYISRVVEKPIVLDNGKVVPVGATVLLGISLIHYDPRVFPEPYVFRPERFIGEAAQLIPPTAYIPFSYGSRNCLGMVFAQLEIKVCIAFLLREFEFHVSTTHEIRYEHAVVSRPREGIYLVISPIHSTDSD